MFTFIIAAAESLNGEEPLEESSSLLTQFFLAFVALIVTLIIMATFKVFQMRQKIKHIPGTWQYFYSLFRIPFIAPYLYFGPTDKMLELMDKIGDSETKTTSLAMMNENSVWISDKDMIKELTITKASDFEKPKDFFDAINIFGENLASVQSENWKRHFKVCNPGFSPKNLEYVCTVAAKSSDLLFNEWKKQVDKDGKVVLNVTDYSDLTLDVLGKAGFGFDFGIFTDDETGRKFRAALEYTITYGIAVRGFILPMSNLLYNIVAKYTGLSDYCDFMSKILNNVIDTRRREIKEREQLDPNAAEKRGEIPCDILSLLVEANMMENALSDGELMSNAFILALAGHETTSTLLQWVSYEISKRPEILKKLQQEVDEKLKGRDPTYEDFPKLDYVNGVIMETLRVHPPVSSIIKVVSKKSTKIGKFDIPKGTIVRAFMEHTHNRSDYWKDPETFNPERFGDFESREKIQHTFTWLPFSSGNRKCIGYRFSLMEGCMILAKLMQNYDFSLLNDEKLDPVTTRTLSVNRPSPNMKVAITPRVK